MILLTLSVGMASACVNSRSGGPPRTTLLGGPTTTPGSFRIAVWGDTPYGSDELAQLPRLVEEINAAEVDFSIMVGDIAAALACEDATYESTVAFFDSFEAPLVYVPGDNEWTDCHEINRDPLERLSKIRQVFFARPDSFGLSRISLIHQSAERPEHTRWVQDQVVFIGLNVTGSNNNHVQDVNVQEQGSPRGLAERQAAEAEYQARSVAVREWMRAGFEAAISGNAAGVVVAIQADPGFEVAAGQRTTNGVDGFDDFLRALAEEATRFSKPVVVVHGDSHQYQFDTPLIDPTTGDAVDNVTRIESPGSPDVGWAEVTLSPDGTKFVDATSRIVAAGARN